MSVRVLAIGVALCVALVACAGSTSRLKVATMSMEPTIPFEAIVTIDRSAYDRAPPQRFDIVAHRDPAGRDDRLFVKRVVAGGGEEVDLSEAGVTVDGVLLDEPYAHPSSSLRDTQPLVVPEGHVYVLGDRRDRSQDSRFYGPVPIDLVEGKVVHITDP